VVSNESLVEKVVNLRRKNNQLRVEIERLREVVQSTTDLYHEAAQEARTAKGDLEVAVVSLSFANDAIQRVRTLAFDAVEDIAPHRPSSGWVYATDILAALDGETDA
jgi:hypothetical protein